MANSYQTPYGIGILALTPTGSNPTVGRLMVGKDVTVKTSIEVEELYGEEIDPVDVADKSRSTEITMKGSGYSSALFSGALGIASSTGSVITVKDESATVPASSTYTCTVTHSGAITDFGVINSTTGLAMIRGASATAAGIYSVDTATGIYTFHSGDASAKVLISYGYAAASTGSTINIGGQLAGAGVRFRLDVARTYNDLFLGITFPCVRLAGMSESFGSQKHGEIDLTFRAMKDPTTGYLATRYFGK